MRAHTHPQCCWRGFGRALPVELVAGGVWSLGLAGAVVAQLGLLFLSNGGRPALQSPVASTATVPVTLHEPIWHDVELEATGAPAAFLVMLVQTETLLRRTSAVDNKNSSLVDLLSSKCELRRSRGRDKGTCSHTHTRNVRNACTCGLFFTGIVGSELVCACAAVSAFSWFFLFFLFLFLNSCLLCRVRHPRPQWNANSGHTDGACQHEV